MTAAALVVRLAKHADGGATLTCAAIRACMAELFARWEALGAGGVLELEFGTGPTGRRR